MASWFLPFANHLTNSSSFVIGGRFDGTSVQGIVKSITLMRNGAVRVEVVQGERVKHLIVLQGYGEVLA